VALASTLAWGQAVSPSGTPNVAGTVLLVDGKATVTSPGGTPRALKTGDTVSEGDEVASARDGEVHLRMVDSGFLVLRPDTKMKIASYKADGGDDDHGVFQLLTGGLRSVSGWIGKFNRKSYTLKTATATIGIRGTDHETRYIPEGSTEGEPGTYDRVYAGRTVIQTSAGTTELAPDQAGYQSDKPGARPRRLASIPQFYRPGPHEVEINAKHAEIQKLIDQRRQERRQAIREKAAALKAERAKVGEVAKGNQAAAKQERENATQERAEVKAKREKLVEDTKAANALREEVKTERASLEDDWKSGRISQKEARQRRHALQEKQKQLNAAQEDIQRRKKEMVEAQDSKIDERFNAAQERQKALHDQQLEAREKRKALEGEQESAAKELKGMQQQENQRYREELKKDKQQGAAPADPSKP
jgi:hypothetical protein